MLKEQHGIEKEDIANLRVSIQSCSRPAVPDHKEHWKSAFLKSASLKLSLEAVSLAFGSGSDNTEIIFSHHTSFLTAGMLSNIMSVETLIGEAKGTKLVLVLLVFLTTYLSLLDKVKQTKKLLIFNYILELRVIFCKASMLCFTVILPSSQLNKTVLHIVRRKS